VQLEGCGHFFEVKEFDEWMDRRDDFAQPKKCPRCNAPILKSFRYGNIIRRLHSTLEDVKNEVADSNSLSAKSTDILQKARTLYLASFFRTLRLTVGQDEKRNLEALAAKTKAEADDLLELSACAVLGINKQRLNLVSLSCEVLSAFRRVPKLVEKHAGILQRLLRMDPKKSSSADLHALNNEFRSALKDCGEDLENEDWKLASTLSYNCEYWKSDYVYRELLEKSKCYT
jgi:hypothetical protein